MAYVSNMDFCAIDVETANNRPSSICQMGMVRVRNGHVESTFCSLVNPEESFNSFNIRIHGIGPDMVRSAPSFDEIFAEVFDWLDGETLVSHTFFDRSAMNGAAIKYGLPIIPVDWLDSVAIARRAWPHRRGGRGYRLASLASDLGISFRHHDALEDARAAAGVVLYACLETGKSIDDWMREFER
ncbi:MAG: 3'-5' exonuclease [Chloroflexota bacterium]|nr:3'-5' exonuclease [Chloroflexota bacterium]